MRCIYCSTCWGEQVQRPEGWPYQPQRQGFMAHTSMKRLGSVREPEARVMVTKPSSSGWRSVSSAALLNSGSSSRNSTPLWARDISPGRGIPPPPESDTVDAVWWGLRKGRVSTSGCVVCRASARDMSGRMDGSRRASMDLPAPGEPTSSTLWPPAAAISSARFTFSCPITSAKSGRGRS